MEQIKDKKEEYNAEDNIRYILQFITWIENLARTIAIIQFFQSRTMQQYFYRQEALTSKNWYQLWRS